MKVGLELFIATFGSMLGAAVLMELLYPFAHALNAGLSFHQFNQVLSLPYFPTQIAFGVMVGYMGRERFGTRFSLWIWIIPLLIFLWHFLAFQPNAFENFWQSRIHHFIGSGCQPADRCLDQMNSTGPLYTSIAYTLGALLKKRTEHREA